MRPKLSLFAILWMASATFSLPQEKIKFGKVSLEEIKMKPAGIDSTASAVILYDRGRLDGISGQFTRHVRIKILTNAGRSFADFAVRTPSKGFINGATYNLEGGQIKETTLAKENVHTEQLVLGFELYKIFFPNVKAGSIIDLKYSFLGL